MALAPIYNIWQYGDGIVVVASVSKTEEVSSILAHRASSCSSIGLERRATNSEVGRSFLSSCANKKELSMRTCNYDCANCIDEKIRNWSADWKAYCKKRRKFNASHEVKQKVIADLVTGESILHTYVVPKWKVNTKLVTENPSFWYNILSCLIWKLIAT